MDKLKKYILLFLITLIPIVGNAKSIVKTIINEVKTQYAPDKRQVVYEIDTKKTDGITTLWGKISDLSVYETLLSRLDSAGVKYINKIEMLPTNKWALVRISVASLRQKKGHASEMATQAVMGTPLRILEKDGDWYRVQTPDGYISYVISSSISLKSESEMSQWRKASRVIVKQFRLLWQLQQQ